MPKKPPVHKIAKVFEDPDLPKVYMNSFECALGLGDVALLLKNGDTTVGVVHMSHTVAKTLSVRLGEMIRFLESKSGTSVLTTSDVEKALRPKKSRSTTLQ